MAHTGRLPGGGAGRRDAARDPRHGARRHRHHHRRRDAPRELLQPLRHRARGHRHRQPRHHDQPQRPADSRAAHRRADPAQGAGRDFRSSVSQKTRLPEDEDHAARAVHDDAAGAGRPLRRRGGGGDGLRRGGERGDPRPQGGGRRRDPDRRALAAGAPRARRALRREGDQPRARGHCRHDGRASVLRLRRGGEGEALGIFLPAAARGHERHADLHRGGAAAPGPRRRAGAGPRPLPPLRRGGGRRHRRASARRGGAPRSRREIGDGRHPPRGVRVR